MGFQDIRKDIKVLGVGTAKDRALLISVWAAAKELGLPVNIVLVSSLERILESGVGAIPALVIENRVVCEGRLPAVTEIIDLLRQNYPLHA
ncbi:MAG: thioredoxin family protein [Haliscomenobacter sp.]|nr:thioredoxin family protein [Haliscomenobacter sp.]MBK8652879.1 thioredoxin family protein [Haliscomenobacter sp.]MBP9076404.1 thioredoxin family protein [Haliscomenobacter sp.]